MVSLWDFSLVGKPTIGSINPSILTQSQPFILNLEALLGEADLACKIRPRTHENQAILRDCGAETPLLVGCEQEKADGRG